MKEFRNGLLGVLMVMLAFFCAITVLSSIKPTATYALTGKAGELNTNSTPNLELATVHDYSLSETGTNTYSLSPIYSGNYIFELKSESLTKVKFADIEKQVQTLGLIAF